MTRLLHTILGLLLGAGFGVIVGFITFAIMEKFNSSTFVILAPSGPLRVGIMGSLLIGVAGSVVGLITGALGLRTFHGAAVGVAIFALVKARRVYYDGKFSLDRAQALLFLVLALTGALVSLSLPMAVEFFALSH